MNRRNALRMLAAAPVAAFGQAQRPSQPDQQKIWDDVYSSADPIYNRYPNRFLAEIGEKAKPGRALDIGIGQGRNAIYLASLGWNVTGIDISEKGIETAKATALRRKLTIEAIQADFMTFDLGKSQWDLISEIYMQGIIIGRAPQIADSLKPEGMLVVEGFHRDMSQKGITGQPLGIEGHQLLTAFAPHLRIVRYEEVRDFGDWTRSGLKVPLVRMVGVRRSA
jgi:SAM-dependent methyltransferase